MREWKNKSKTSMVTRNVPVLLAACLFLFTACYSYSVTNNGSFIFINDGLAWLPANEYCLDRFGTSLATIYTISQFNELTSACNEETYVSGGYSAHSSCWIGITDLYEEANWEWVSNDGTLIALSETYILWYGSSPNSGYFENCGRLRDTDGSNTGWGVADGACSVDLAFFCNINDTTNTIDTIDTIDTTDTPTSTTLTTIATTSKTTNNDNNTTNTPNTTNSMFATTDGNVHVNNSNYKTSETINSIGSGTGTTATSDSIDNGNDSKNNKFSEGDLWIVGAVVSCAWLLCISLLLGICIFCKNWKGKIPFANDRDSSDFNADSARTRGKNNNNNNNNNNISGDSGNTIDNININNSGQQNEILMDDLNKKINKKTRSPGGHDHAPQESIEGEIGYDSDNGNGSGSGGDKSSIDMDGGTFTSTGDHDINRKQKKNKHKRKKKKKTNTATGGADNTQHPS